jgi:isopentenyl diphosphate isomerase/L-lactate dehydrogenase-like FMN-dependent dehydrogenase
VAGEYGLPYSLSTAGSVSIEDAAEHNAIGAAKGVEQQSGAEHKEGLRFFQLYATHDEELNESLLTRAHKSGYDACMMTLDTWQLAWRCVQSTSFYSPFTNSRPL